MRSNRNTRKARHHWILAAHNGMLSGLVETDWENWTERLLHARQMFP